MKSIGVRKGQSGFEPTSPSPERGIEFDFPELDFSESESESPDKGEGGAACFRTEEGGKEEVGKMVET